MLGWWNCRTHDSCGQQFFYYSNILRVAGDVNPFQFGHKRMLANSGDKPGAVSNRKLLSKLRFRILIIQAALSLGTNIRTVAFYNLKLLRVAEEGKLFNFRFLLLFPLSQIGIILITLTNIANIAQCLIIIYMIWAAF